MNLLFRHTRPLRLVLPAVALLLAYTSRSGGGPTVAAASEAPALNPAQAEFFEKSVRPVLSNNCYTCHAANTKSAGALRVDDLQALLKGGRSGPAIVPGDPQNSLLLQRLLTDDEKHRMPKGDDPLQKSDIDNLTTWIKAGAYWPASTDSAEPGKNAKPVDDSKAADSKPKVKLVAKFNPDPPKAQLAYFEKNVKPILASHCYACHAADTKPAGRLRLDTTIGIETGGNSGSSVLPGDPDKSLILVRVLQTDKKHRMPKDSDPLTADEIAKITTWIKNGAALPDETEKLPPLSAKLERTYTKLKAEHWAFKPLSNPTVPNVKDTKWPAQNKRGTASGDIDRFLLAGLETKDLAPVPDADPVTLLRRVTYDLTGLPATPEEVKAFRKDHSEKAYEELVDHLLASQQYGERWGRHWLDVARYAESTGPSRNIPYPHAWRYRDYVIDSVNKDVPYDRFLKEQIAGDLLPEGSPADRDRLLIATGFLAIGVKDVNQRFEARFLMDNVDDQIDTVTRSTMALTVSCARCHDHKFDPIPATDYYALAGIFTSTDDAAGVNSLMGGAGLAYYNAKDLLLLSSATTAPSAQEDKVAKLKADIASTKKQLDAIQGTPDGLVLGPDKKPKQLTLGLKMLELRKELLDLTDPGTRGYGIHGAREGDIADTSVRVRGVEERHGPTVPRGFLTAFQVPGANPVNPKQSGRLELADWIASPQNPLTARVAVNHIWQHLFGQGIVSTVDNFGIKGDVPSNPQLLDYLAAEYIREGWSTKRMIRNIVLTHAYRLGSTYPERYKDIDPANYLIWRHSPRRLEAEEVRDSVLASSGRLQLLPPGAPLPQSPAAKLKMIELADNGKELQEINAGADNSNDRSVYLPALRGITPRALAAFDPVSQTLVTGQRDTTIVPTQALFLLNSSFVRVQSQNLAQKLLADSSKADRQIEEAYLRVLDREPSKQEIVRDRQFLAEYAQTYSKLPTDVPAPPVEVKTSVVKKEDDKDKEVVIDPACQVDQTNVVPVDPVITYRSPQEAALAGLVQTLYASAEFQFLR
ncbi:mono/diheme cytochrome c family protein [Granulicella aggregans]|uniref:Mono/diheme cytochrome c family protein n=1 Tax=Granulicella aggregans TaxID=474949 RepID=A0A7W8E598_9BACT|nr:PSD1 and planctomycete cytochrome C domain-containing protein [Granulicella aggregans]MBB5059447.1 mono/diheme cytochrome c family protein [Granulicella aggregans]